MSSLAWHIAERKGEAIAWFSICEVLELHNPVNGDCLLLCLQMILEIESPGKCYQLALPTDKNNADTMLTKLARIFLQNNLHVGIEDKSSGSVKLTYEGSWLDMWRLIQIADKEGLPSPIQIDTASTEKGSLSVIPFSDLHTKLKNDKQADRQWVIILGSKVVALYRKDCLLKGFELIQKHNLSHAFMDRLKTRLAYQQTEISFGINESQLTEWVDTYPCCQSVSSEANKLLEVFAASVLCQLFGTSWWAASINNGEQPVELIQQLSSKKITLVTQDWHNITEQMWGFNSMSVEEAINSVRTDSVRLDIKLLEGKVVHLLGSFSQPETLLPSFTSALATENSAAFLLGLFKLLNEKKCQHLKIALIGTDEDEELKDGLSAWYRSTRPDIDIQGNSKDQATMRDRVFYFTAKYSKCYVVS